MFVRRPSGPNTRVSAWSGTPVQTISSRTKPEDHSQTWFTLDASLIAATKTHKVTTFGNHLFPLTCGAVIVRSADTEKKIALKANDQ